MTGVVGDDSSQAKAGLGAPCPATDRILLDGFTIHESLKPCSQLGASDGFRPAPTRLGETLAALLGDGHDDDHDRCPRPHRR